MTLNPIDILLCSIDDLTVNVLSNFFSSNSSSCGSSNNITIVQILLCMITCSTIGRVAVKDMDIISLSGGWSYCVIIH